MRKTLAVNQWSAHVFTPLHTQVWLHSTRGWTYTHHIHEKKMKDNNVSQRLAAISWGCNLQCCSHHRRSFQFPLGEHEIQPEMEKCLLKSPQIDRWIQKHNAHNINCTHPITKVLLNREEMITWKCCHSCYSTLQVHKTQAGIRNRRLLNKMKREGLWDGKIWKWWHLIHVMGAVHCFATGWLGKNLSVSIQDVICLSHKGLLWFFISFPFTSP